MPTQRWTDALLDSMRTRTDELADSVILEIHGGGASRYETNRNLLQNLIRTQDIVPADLPPRVRAYFEHDACFPEDVDLDRIRNGQRLFMRYAGEMCWLLTCASLPTCYACERGAKVLALSKRISDIDMARRRIFETAQFVLDVMSPDLLEPHGRGLRTVQKVRLMHASIRYFIRSARDGKLPSSAAPDIVWDPSWGEPINQEDLANTLMSFSVTILRGLERFGREIDPHQAEDYVYLWNQVGLLLGVAPELIPEDRAEAETLLDTICARNWEPGDAGSRLTATLLEFAEDLLPGRTFDGLAAATVRLCFDTRRLGDKDLCEILKIPRRWLPELMLSKAVELGDELDELFDDLLFRSVFRELRWRGCRLTDYLGRALMQAFLDLERGGQRTRFEIPTSLSEPLALPAQKGEAA
jgi:hypothetical protein